jgi:hypothetical protein
VLGGRSFRCTLGASRRFDGDGRKAKRAILGGGLGRRRFFFPIKPADEPDQYKDGDGNDDKADEGIDKNAIMRGVRL